MADPGTGGTRAGAAIAILNKPYTAHVRIASQHCLHKLSWLRGRGRAACLYIAPSGQAAPPITERHDMAKITRLGWGSAGTNALDPEYQAQLEEKAKTDAKNKARREKRAEEKAEAEKQARAKKRQRRGPSHLLGTARQRLP